jgi:hypothetical protein
MADGLAAQRNVDHEVKTTAKLHDRYVAFKALWPALQKYNRSLRKATHQTFEHYLNLIRLSFLSMPNYVLHTSTPSSCVTYSRMASQWALALIVNVLPSFIILPAHNSLSVTEFTDLLSISQRIMQLPLSRGGFSL